MTAWFERRTAFPELLRNIIAATGSIGSMKMFYSGAAFAQRRIRSTVKFAQSSCPCILSLSLPCSNTSGELCAARFRL